MSTTPFPKLFKRIPLKSYLLIAAGFLAIQEAALLAMGQPLICQCGSIRFWTGSVLSAENSQQLTDWYTLTHIIHGFAFYWFLWLVLPRFPVGMRFTLAVGLGSIWEVIENTSFVIDRYRQSALAQGYVGDSVINSITDTLAAAFGFLLAHTLPVWSTVLLTIAIEVFVGLMIRDNLTLNIIQLIFLNDTISKWQTRI
jgi:hypothetical protein